ncbi:MAG: molybdopterin-dependent oxidoreductase [Rhodospirillales bacterium]|jgi:trimethylamine-N-oxide reductase (cytochrome c)|nr:molybdopterin-dependent oxidoreductase [Rhodospirillales bacterium]
MAITRRTFINGTGATFALGGLMGSTALSSVFASTAQASMQKTFHASHYGAFKAIVEDGVLVDVETIPEIDARPTPMLTEGIVDRTYHRTRVKYPMVRKSYLENWASGDRKVELRGKEPFVRVDWDTALKMVVKESLDTIEKHGNEAIFNSSYGGWSHAGLMRPNVLQGRLFNLLGGTSMTVGDYSGGASQVSLPHIVGDMEVYSPQTAWENLMNHSEIVVWIGCDPFKNNRIEYRVADHQMYPRWEKIRDNGVKFVSINPQFSTTDQWVDSEWVKIVPNTDVALFSALAYHVYTNDMHDQAFLDKYTVGADKWLDYITGKEDGVKKTPAWAAKITGIAEDKIIEMAQTFATKRTQFAGAWSLQRAHHGELTHWAIVNFCALIGNIGKPGEGFGFSWHYGNGGMPQGGNSLPVGLSQGKNFTPNVCPASRISEMLLNPGKEIVYNGNKSYYPKTVKMIYNAGVNFMSHQQDTNELIGALNVVDTVVVQDPWWCASTRWADIVLPATSSLERNDITSGGTYSNNKIYAMKKTIEPVGESLDDFEIFRRMAEMMGVEMQFTETKTMDELLQFAYEKATISKQVPFEEFWERGWVDMDTPDEANDWVRHGDFRADPDKHRLHTESGKVEMFCETIAAQKLDDCPGIPKYLEAAEFLGNAKEGQVHVVSPHPYYRLHSQMANADRVRARHAIQDREPCLISTEDAELRGIKDGDLIEVYNDRGAIIVGAVVSDNIMKGVISIYEGCWPSVDSKGRCNSGLVNFLTSSRRSSGLSQATTANTCLASVKKCNDPDGPNAAYNPPNILNKVSLDISDDLVNGDRGSELLGGFLADMEPGEKMFYERCTVCHGPREPRNFTQNQWKGVTQTMFERAGLEPDERKLVLDFLLKSAKDAPAL